MRDTTLTKRLALSVLTLACLALLAAGAWAQTTAGDAAEPTPSEAAEPAADDTAEPAPTGLAEPAADDTAEPAPTGLAEPAADDTAEPAPTELAEPAADDTAEPAPTELAEPAADDTAEPAADDTTEPAEEPAEEPTADGVNAAPDEVEGLTEAVQVLVVRDGPDIEPTPVSGVTVTLRGAQQMAAVAPRSVSTDESGVATFELPVDGARWAASVTDDGLEFIGDRVVIAGEREESTVTLYERRADPTGLRASRLITLGRLHEAYLVFESYWFIYVEGEYVFQAEDGLEGLEIRLPEGAEGIHVVDPVGEDHVAVGDTGVTLLGPIGPRGAIQTDGPTLFMTFSLPNESETHEFSQTMPIPVDEVIILIPQVTEFERFPELSVDLRVPVCDGVDHGQYVCFDDPTPLAAGTGLMPNIERREVHGGHGLAGAVLTFETVGWPATGDPFEMAALLGVVAILLAGVVLYRRFAGRSRGLGANTMSQRRLDRERRRLLVELKRAQQEYETGELPVSEFESLDLLLRFRLEALYEALGQDPDPPGASPEDDAPPAERVPTKPASRAGEAGPPT